MVNTGGHRWPGGKLHAGDVPDLRPIATRGGGGGGGEAGSPWSGQPVALCFLLLNGLPGEGSLKNEEGEAPAVCHPQIQKGVIL